MDDEKLFQKRGCREMGTEVTRIPFICRARCHSKKCRKFHSFAYVMAFVNVGPSEVYFSTYAFGAVTKKV